MSPVPRGASLDRLEAGRIAADLTRLGEAYQYWRRAFEALGEDPFAATPDTPAMRFARLLPAGRYDALLPERRHLTSALDAMTQESGCLASVEDLAKAVDSGSGEGLFKDVLAFAGAAIEPKSSTDGAAIARGIRGCRELFDAARRFAYCKMIGEALGLTAAECLALFRQEGALGVTPPVASYPHGPLIRTGFVCRVSTVSLFDRSAERSGFVLNYEFRVQTDALTTEVSRSFDALYRNILVVGGLDSIVLPRLPATDELVHFLTQARNKAVLSAAYADLLKVYRETQAKTRTRPINIAWKRSQQGLFDELSIGLTMARLEAGTTSPKVLYVLDDLAADMAGLVDAHPTSTSKVGGVTRLFLEDDDAGSGVQACLKVLLRWMASRADPRTLYARRDRPGSFTDFDRFSPFVTYLRFHSGDAIFMGIVLRCIVAFESLDAAWKKNRGRWGEAFRDALGASLWSKAEGRVLKSDLETHWKPKVGQEDAWRHLGLLDALRSHPSAPDWVTPAPAPSPRLLKTAEVAARVMNAIRDQGIQDALEKALEFTPVSDLLALGVVPNSDLRPVFSKSHSFERARKVYQETLDAADL